MELSEEQRSAVRWQWLLMGSMIALMALAFVVTQLLGLNAGELVSNRGENNLFFLLVCACCGLCNLMIGILSVRYQVTIQGRRLKFWEPIEGGMAVFHGWMAIAASVILIGVGLVLSLESGSSTLALIYLGSLFALLALGGVVYGLRRGFSDQD